MERAAAACVQWITARYPESPSFAIFCGKGNNGGDGLAMARLLTSMQYEVAVYILEFGFRGTEEFQENLERLHAAGFTNIHFIQSSSHFPVINKQQVIIDALLGTGLNRKLDGITEMLVQHINQSGKLIISIDIPSGMYADRSSKGITRIRASHTLAFQCYKVAFLLPENNDSLGQLEVIDIGLDPTFLRSPETTYEWVDKAVVSPLYKSRNPYSHKGIFGHALLVAGSYGKMGAAVLAAQACMRSGVGLLTCHIPACGYTIMQTSAPEVMVETDNSETENTGLEKISGYASIGIGPGLGTDPATAGMLRQLLTQHTFPLVIDADALNLIASNDLLSMIPRGSVLTPHPGEFERLLGKSHDDFERISLAMTQAKAIGCIIILKGHHSFIATGDKGYFNTTGNAGMATAGSGDVLTGIITGLLAQGYSSLEASLLGVYLHGLAGDLAMADESMESLIAGDIIDNMGKAFRSLPGIS